MASNADVVHDGQHGLIMGGSFSQALSCRMRTWTIDADHVASRHVVGGRSLDRAPHEVLTITMRARACRR